MMPVDELPRLPGSQRLCWVLYLLFSITFHLTKLALDQSNYDWGMLAYAVGFGVPSPGLGHRPEWPSRTSSRRAPSGKNG